ncbi:transcriptional regulator with XRE-family HTH domain [Kribbella amoyensis]|uniref:Transcriptional regulator with XRE-family HTH domain n=1 Tax=Kribbella amoyensis TaxID=996641 RepID=A0A561BRZ8_9ACTN|nr:helix-turn-helix transcriptional regulator [Kribbella amoyensis]TWD81552.1 transcriptional regulator with XRE-family HTH domain [Kribbella amoyensis]
MARLSDRAADAMGSVGEYLAEQRRHAQLSLRQLSDLAGVSNPYLSQIERGLRKPSADVLQQLAKALRISAETLYVRAGILDPDESEDGTRRTGVADAILLDPALNERQKRVLLDVYASFVRENEVDEAPDEKPVATPDESAAASKPAARKTAASTSAVRKTAAAKRAARPQTPASSTRASKRTPQ